MDELNIYKEILNTLGDNIAEYNVGAWALFRDKMATEITSQYLFGNSRKVDESLLAYSMPDIVESNKLTKGGVRKDDGTPSVKRVDFTYYTENGPEKKLNTRPVLIDPSVDTLKENVDFKVPFKNESTFKYENGDYVYGEYNEEGLNVNLNNGLGRGRYSTDITDYKEGETLVSKTRNWFKTSNDDYISKRFKTLISRFHTSDGDIEELKDNIGIQAYSNKYGLSRGSNLLKDGHVSNKSDGKYDDPYCRVWTWHKQYSKLVSDTIRPFNIDASGNTQTYLDEQYGWKAFRSKADASFEDGGTRLGKYGVMYDNGGHTNGLVNITPSIENGSTGYDDPRNVSVERCMFSIENLAWKGTFSSYGEEIDENGLSREQKGPLGGRIMWFPPYDLKFDESTNANWNINEFIGRGEPIYTYANTNRSGTLSFKLLVDHPSVLDYWDKRNKPNGNYSDEFSIDSTKTKEQELLRFFAGCSVLSAKGQPTDYGTVGNGDGSGENGTNGGENPSNEPPTQNEKPFVIVHLYYPNDYSGVDDGGNIDPIEYILNGVGTNIVGASNQVEWTQTNTNYTSGSSVVGGYEMRENVGISIAKLLTPIGDDDITVVKKGDEQLTLKKIRSGSGKEWYYRVDNAYLDSIFDHPMSYIDNNSSCFNSIGYLEALNGKNDYLRLSGNTYSFVDLYVALNYEKKDVFKDLYDDGRVETLKQIIPRVTEAWCYGNASSQGNNPDESVNNRRNDDLARNRAETTRKWLSQALRMVDVSVGDHGVDSNTNYARNDANDPNAKAARFATIQLFYNDASVENADGTVIGDDNANSTAVSSRRTTMANDTITDSTNRVSSVTSSVRYDNEALFFQRLKENDPFMTRLITDRIKNFDPVFHSVSPEGFNARATFLNQCMRQGPTISSYDTNGENANNLAFGRSPVCVLRLGDFYNTKIIITSLRISFENLMWDLNQEGIGVMPMIADVSMSFYFIGGSDLGGPIQRLQNAASFNYYANASVYDNRAEEIEYNKGKETKFKAFRPTIVNG